MFASPVGGRGAVGLASLMSCSSLPGQCAAVAGPDDEADCCSAHDELGMFDEICLEYNIPWRGIAVRRKSFVLSDGITISGLLWGEAAPEFVLLHGGKQTAHTWDAVALALNRPLLALDLPSHGHSDATASGIHDPSTLAASIAEVMDQAAASAEVVCGMSLGGLAGIALSAERPDLVRRLVLVDVTPGITTKRPPHSSEVEGSTSSFPSFDHLLVRMQKMYPSRSRASLRRTILFNTVQRDDGSWIWRHDRHPRRHPRRSAFDRLWEQLDSVRAPTMLVRGMNSKMVDSSDESELARRVPDLRVEHLPEAGHSVQADQPVALAALLESFCAGAELT